MILALLLALPFDCTTQWQLNLLLPQAEQVVDIGPIVKELAQALADGKLSNDEVNRLAAVALLAFGTGNTWTAVYISQDRDAVVAEKDRIKAAGWEWTWVGPTNEQNESGLLAMGWTIAEWCCPGWPEPCVPVP